MAHNVESMMYVGEKPWHGLGTYVGEREITAKEAIEKAGLDWKVGLRELYASDADGSLLVVPKKFATIREDNSRVLGVVGKNYRPLQNSEAFNFLDSIVGPESAVYHTAGSLGIGERIWILVKFPSVMRITKDDVVEKYFMVTNTHDGSTSVQVLFTPVRVVCQNTLHQALETVVGSERMSVKHTHSLISGLDRVKKIMFNAEAFWHDMENSSVRLLNTRLSEESRKEYVKASLGIGQQIEGEEEVEITDRQNEVLDAVFELAETGKGTELEGVKGTLWGDYNALVEYVDYLRPVRKADKIPTKRIDSIIFGSGREIKERAWSEALKIAA